MSLVLEAHKSLKIIRGTLTAGRDPSQEDSCVSVLGSPRAFAERLATRGVCSRYAGEYGKARGDVVGLEGVFARNELRNL
ncbi:MAG TPA: hypothetical protein VIJ39_10665 [Solirubrobacteraceae bacterium]